MIEVFVVNWDVKKGYIVNNILASKHELSKDFLELIFFKALGSIERRLEPAYWLQDFRNQRYHCYFLGPYSSTPTIIVSRGDDKNIVKVVLYDLSIRVRYIGLDKLSEHITDEYRDVLRNLNSKLLPLFVFTNSLVARLYWLLARNPVINLDEFIELAFHERISASARDIQDVLTILSSIGFVRVVWVRGSIWLEISKIILPLRRPLSISFASLDLRKLADEFFMREEFLNELEGAVRVFLNDRLRNALSRLIAEKILPYSFLPEGDINYLVNKNYIDIRNGTIHLKSEPIIKIYNLAGEKIYEFKIR